MAVSLVCVECGREHEPSGIWRCEGCSGMLEVRISEVEISREELDARLSYGNTHYSSGVWRYKELIHPLIEEKMIVSRHEGNTGLYTHSRVSEFSGIKELYMKHEGENPTGSFKDRGMTVGISEAVRLGSRYVGCASTGNTSSSLASYASVAGISSVVFVPSGKIALGKLSQTLAYGAKAIQINGNFDDAMRLVQEAAERLGIYLLNSINPWRIEGQKAMAFELIQQLGWESPDWICLPAGNLGNTSAVGKALSELVGLGLIEDMPRIAAVQADGASPFYNMWKNGYSEIRPVEPHTLATAISIGNPVSWKKAMKSIKDTNGVVERVTDQEILDAKAVIDSSGIGCEPASAASLAGAKRLRSANIIKEGESVACILTGSMLKDPEITLNYHMSRLDGIDARHMNAPIAVEADIDKIVEVFGKNAKELPLDKGEVTPLEIL